MIARVPTALKADAVLTEADRLQRIGEWVCRAARFVVPESSPADSPVPVTGANLAPNDSVLAYLRFRPEASPLELRLSLGLSRSMTHRILLELLAQGLVTRHGRTKAIVYRSQHPDPTRN